MSIATELYTVFDATLQKVVRLVRFFVHNQEQTNILKARKDFPSNTKVSAKVEELLTAWNKQFAVFTTLVKDPSFPASFIEPFREYASQYDTLLLEESSHETASEALSACELTQRFLEEHFNIKCCLKLQNFKQQQARALSQKAAALEIPEIEELALEQFEDDLSDEEVVYSPPQSTGQSLESRVLQHHDEERATRIQTFKPFEIEQPKSNRFEVRSEPWLLAEENWDYLKVPKALQDFVLAQQESTFVRYLGGLDSYFDARQLQWSIRARLFWTEMLAASGSDRAHALSFYRMQVPVADVAQQIADLVEHHKKQKALVLTKQKKDPQSGKCWHCNQTGHRYGDCPKLKGKK